MYFVIYKQKYDVIKTETISLHDPQEHRDAKQGKVIVPPNAD